MTRLTATLAALVALGLAPTLLPQSRGGGVTPGTAMPEAAGTIADPSIVPAARPTPSAASRSRVARPRPRGRGGAGHVLDWRALAECESGGDPRAVSASGKYRGAFQADASFWRTYGGLEFAPRPDLATYAEQLIVAKRGYAARGWHPWPVCGSRLTDGH